jgi:hypothetical protein
MASKMYASEKNYAAGKEDGLAGDKISGAAKCLFLFFVVNYAFGIIALGLIQTSSLVAISCNNRVGVR